MTTPLLSNNDSRRLGVDRRQFSYDFHIPERRSGKDRRSGFDRRLKPRTVGERNKNGKIIKNILHNIYDYIFSSKLV